MRQWSGLFLFLVLVFAVATTGSWFTASSVGTWYRELTKPSWTPPSWVFGPVWTVLYLLMAIAAWLVWQRRAEMPVAGALTLWSVQLAFNLLWSILFFGLREPALGMLDISLLWLAILATMLAFYRVRPPAMWLLLPYLLWVSYAATLNYGIWRMNPPQ